MVVMVFVLIVVEIGHSNDVGFTVVADGYNDDINDNDADHTSRGNGHCILQQL